MKSKKRILSLFLCIFLCLFLITDVSFAQTENQSENEPAEITAEDELSSNTDAEPSASEEPDDSEKLSVSEDENSAEDTIVSEKESASDKEEIQINQSATLNEPLKTASYSVSAVSAETASQPAPSAKAAARADVPAATASSTPAATAANNANTAAASTRAAAAPATNPTVTCSAANSSQRNFNIVLKNAVIPNGATVKFAVWSEKNGQDDLIWYTGTKSGSNYTASVPVQSHKTAGNYVVHAYYQTVQGQLNGLCSGSFTVSSPSSKGVSFSRIDNNTGSFRVVVNNLTAPSGITEVKIPVWCSPDQSDMVWYTATKNPNTDHWFIDTNIANHGYHMGTYHAHVYATDGNGIQSGIGSASSSIGGKKGYITAKAADSAQSVFYVSITNATVPNGCTVKLAIWSNQNGQDDLVWYNAAKSGNSYTAVVPISAHKSVGTYTVHAYYQTPQGQMNGLCTGTFTVSGITQKSISISNINKNTGTFRINVDVAAPAGIKDVRVAVWSAKDQNDIYWYSATKSGNSYIVNADIANHKFNTGTYNAHAYATLNNGIDSGIAGTSANITTNKYIGVTKVANGEYKVVFRSEKPVNGVNIAVWSDANGQDDLVWYPALHEGGNVYSIVVNARNHLSPGAFTAHIYADNKNVGATAFDIPADEFGTEAERRLNAHVQSVYNTVGRDLYANYCWVKNTFSYSRRAGHITPPEGYTREQWYAVEGFERHTGNCYTYAAAFYELAKGLGYNAQYVEGAVYGYGKWQPHGFVLIYLDGTTYICDPELEYASTRGRNLYMQPMSAPRATYRLWQ